MKLAISLLTLSLLGSSSFVFAQVKKPIAKPKATPTVDSPKPAVSIEIPKESNPTQKVVVEKTNGDRLTGLFVSGNTDSITVSISGSKLQIPFNEITSLRFSEEQTPEPSPVKPVPLEPEVETTLSFEAAIVYKMGGAQPVARTEFALLDASLMEILAMAGLTGEKNLDLASTYGFALKFSDQKKYQQFLQTAGSAIKSHILAVATSDFTGKGEFRGLKPGTTYWVTSYASTRSGFAVWDVPVFVKKGANQMVLDAKNAATAF